MAEDFQDYNGTTRFDNVMGLAANHFKFVLNDLPDLTFFAQSVILPDITSSTPKRTNPFTTIPEVGDHLEFGSLSVSYLVDASFKSYFSLFYWLKGYGFPKSYEDVANFKASRQRKLPNPRPLARELQKTNAVLYIMRPDTDQAIVEIRFEDVFPIQVGQMTFETTANESPVLKTQCTFAYTDFDVHLTT